MPHEQKSIIDIEDQLINAFRPIEQLFQVLDNVKNNDSAQLSQSYSEIGLALCSNFRGKLKESLQAIKGEQPNE